MISTKITTKLYDIRKIPGQEEYNSYCNGTFFAPKNKKIIRCGTGREEMIDMTEKEKQKNINILKNIYKSCK